MDRTDAERVFWADSLAIALAWAAAYFSGYVAGVRDTSPRHPAPDVVAADPVDHAAGGPTEGDTDA